MKIFAHSARISSRLHPLAASVAAIFALTSPLAIAAPTTWVVNTCSDANIGSGITGSLRFAAQNAVSGDTIDMTGLPPLMCSAISLQTGAITLAQDTLTINGPGMNNLTITGKYNNVVENDRIFKHTGSGVLAINGLAIGEGLLTSTTGEAAGGCIYSKGSVTLSHVAMYFCEAKTVSGSAQGGAIYTVGSLKTKYSNVFLSSTNAGASGSASGGGLFSNGPFTCKYSSISANTAHGDTGNIAGYGGGLFLAGNASFTGCTVSANSAGGSFGGIDIFNLSSSGLSTAITSSTISENSATNLVGGLYTNSGTVKIKNSTIAFNTAGIGRSGSSFPFNYFAPGVSFSAFGGSQAVELESSMFTNNIYGTSDEDDLSTTGTTAAKTITFSGAKNLVRASFTNNLPADTIHLACPQLGPLRNNGGLTETHALLSHSPGIDQGDAGGLSYDQRGSVIFNGVMNYPRVSGMSNLADIGAYEVQQDDIIFNTSHESCPLLF